MQLPHGPEGSDAGSILRWVLTLVGVAVAAVAFVARSWVQTALSERAEDRKYELDRRKREADEDAETRRKERETLERMARSAEAVPGVLGAAIERMGMQVATGFEAMGRRWAEHEARILEHEKAMQQIYTAETRSLVGQIHDAVVAREAVTGPRSSRASQPDLSAATIARSGHKLG